MLRSLLVTMLVTFPAVGEVISLDPSIAFDDLAAHYRRGPSAERVEVRATTAGQTRAEPILLQIQPPDVVQLTVGGLTAWSDSRLLRVVDRLDEQAYFERGVGSGGVMAALAEVLPPLPLPELALAFGAEPSEYLTAYCAGVTWTSASVDDAARPAVISVTGSSERVGVELKADAATGRILRMLTTLDGGATTIELTTEPLAAAEAPPIGVDVSRRERVNDLGEFRPRRALVLVGDVMPPLGLMVWRDDRPTYEEPRGPAAVILIRHWRPGASPRAAYEASRRVVAERPGFGLYAGLTFEPGEPNVSAIASGAAEEAEPLPIYRGFDPEGTIVRFSKDADQILVVIDQRGIVRLIESLTPPIAGAALDTGEVDRLAGLTLGAISGAAQEKR